MTIIATRVEPSSTIPAGPTPPGLARGLLAVLTLLLLTVVAGLAVTGSSAATGSASGLSDAGALTTRLLPVTRGLFDLAAIGAIGSTTALAWLVPWDRPDATRRLRAASAGWASAWCVAALAYLVCSAAQVVGVPVTRVFAAPDLLLYGVDLPQGRALLLVVVGSLSLALWISAARTTAVARAWALLAPALLAPLLATGHAATASNHFLATQTLLVHVLAVSLWMGGLLAVVLHLRGDRRALVVAVTRFSRLALLCFLAVAASGLVGAWTRLGLDPDVWRSDYGMLMVAKTALFGALAALGWAHRRYSLPALATGQRRVFARIAAVEVSLMTAALGLAVVLGRTAPPIAASLRAAPPHAAAFPTVDPTLPPLRPLSALLETRPDALVATFLVAAAALLVIWARRGPADARPTPSQGICLAAGFGLAAWALVGGLGAYSTALLSAQVSQVLVLMVLVPALLARGLPSPRLTALVDRGRRLRVGVLLQPTNAAVLAVVVLGVTFQTPLLELSLSSELGHLLVGLAALAAGCLVVLPLVAERSRPARPVSGLLLIAAVLAWYGGRMWLTTVPMAGGWFRDLDLVWADAAVDQRFAGAVALAFAVGLLALAAAQRAAGSTSSTSTPPVSLG